MNGVVATTQSRSCDIVHFWNDFALVPITGGPYA